MLLTSIIKSKIAMLGYQFAEESASDDEAVINMILGDVQSYIKNFCNLEELEGDILLALTGYITDKVAGQFVFLKRTTGQMDGMISFQNNPVSVSEGDTSISFGSGAVSPEESYTKELDRMRLHDAEELIKYRRVAWRA